MQAEQIKSQCSTMSDEELARVIILDRESYSENYLQIAQQEFKQRGIKLDEFFNRVVVRFNNGKPQTVNIREAINRLKQDLKVWDSWEFTNALGQTFFLQKGGVFRVVHFSFGGEYLKSFLVETMETLWEVFRRFFLYKDWQSLIEDEHDLRNWEVLLSGEYPENIVNISNVLKKCEIPYIVKSAGHARFNGVLQGRFDESSLSILVPSSDLDTAFSVIDEIQKTIDYLYNRAEEFAESGDLQKELKIYEHLEKLNPNDAVIYFNKGVIVFELEKFDEAVDQFIESTVKGEAENNWEVIEDSESYLKQLTEKLPNNTDILHTLATLSLEQEKFADAEKYFQKILFINPEDKGAHLNLGHIYYQGGDQNDKALQHFSKYLELNPTSEDRVEIDSIIANLR